MQQLDLSPSILDSHSGVLEVDKVFLLNLPQHETDFFSLELIIIADNNQIVMINSFCSRELRSGGFPSQRCRFVI